MQEFLINSGVLAIDLGALIQNYQILGDRVGANVGVAGILKANAYGLGLKEVATELKKQGCPQFFVATLEEALELRSFDENTPLAVLGGLFQGQESTYIEKNIIPVLNSPDDIKRWNKWGQDENKKVPAFLHFDTGMNRLGLSRHEFEILRDDPSQFKAVNVQMVMSHFVAADDWAQAWAKELTIAQGDLFSDIAVRAEKLWPNVKKSLANSPGAFRSPHYHYDMVRPGYALYGGNPTPEKTNLMHHVVSLKARILQIRRCKKHETIGYGASYKLNKDTRTATIAVGYADGFLRSASSSKDNQAVVYYEGQPCPVIGRVSMDMVTIDISKVKDKPPAQGDAIEILGQHQSVDDLAKSASTIGYEILTSLGHRYKREYIKG